MFCIGVMLKASMSHMATHQEIGNHGDKPIRSLINILIFLHAWD